MKSTPSRILEELESDDELPDSCNDKSIQPAYLDDNRFSKIKFPWINNIYQEYADTRSKMCLMSQYHDKKFPHEGILKQQDLYCLKSVESNTCSSTLIWFVNFMLHKDLQSHYYFLKSCLVNDINSSNLFSKDTYGKSDDNVTNNKFEIIIKV